MLKFGLCSAASILAVTAMAFAAPTASAFPTGSSLPSGSAGSGDGRDEVIIDGTVLLSDLDSCWASGFPRDIRFENRSRRTFLVYGSKDCTGEPTATVAPGGTATYYGWSAVAAG
ncbi:hypothetical protein [Nocardia terpenica]|uniref:Uncharacterized protein n=1 Tax=Nocardia terpenica TaxID=455432 RepID=A0A6G9Z609_9NOCA|nr:hypothetical protein [Nocardia terpenica]QIS21029.1 hypothetical protein F6W96_24635 [Nocardia terpenica]